MKIKLYFLFLLILNSHFLLAQKFGGIVKDESGNPIENANILLVEDNLNALTDSEGKWELQLNTADKKTIVFNKENYTYEQLINQLPNTDLEIVLRDAIPSAASLREDEYVLDGCASVTIPDNSDWNVSFKITELKGDLAPDKNHTRRDPSAVIKVDEMYYVYYSYSLTFDETKLAPWDRNDIYFATSSDGEYWVEQGAAVQRGSEGSFDARSVFTTEIFAYAGKYYLVYQAAKDEDGIYNRNTVGMSIADSPDGPWIKLDKPILHPTYTNDLFFDNNAVHDPCLVSYNNKFYLYYKGECNCRANDNCKRWCNPVCGLNKQVKWGVAIADNPTGPFVKSEYNPVTNTGHEVMVWPYKNGVAILQHQDGPEANSIQFAVDGVNFVPMGEVSNIPEAAGLFRAAKSENNPHAGIKWGLGHKLMWNAGPKGWMYIYRFDIVDNEPTGINIIPDKLQIGEGQKRNLSIKLEPFTATANKINWVSKNKNIASINGGMVVGNIKGTTLIYATSSHGTTIDSCEIHVQKQPFDEITINTPANSFKSTGGTFNDASSGGPGYGVKKNASEINFVNKNDWSTYDVYVPKTGVYELNYEISSPTEHPEVSMKIENTLRAKDKVYTNGAWSSYYTLKSEHLIHFQNTGNMEVKLIASGEDNWQWNLKSFSFARLYGLELTTSLKSFSKNIQIYSNPSENQIFIYGIKKSYDVSLFSMLGQKCYSKNHWGDSIIRLDAGFAGTFLIQILQGTNVFTSKIFL